MIFVFLIPNVALESSCLGLHKFFGAIGLDFAEVTWLCVCVVTVVLCVGDRRLLVFSWHLQCLPCLLCCVESVKHGVRNCVLRVGASSCQI